MLPQLGQADFSAGMFRGVARHLVPENGAYDLLNFLLDDEDGSPYKRGGSAWLSDAATNAFGLTALWDGSTVGGDRTLVMGFNSAISPELNVVSANDATLSVPLDSGGTALDLADTGVKFSQDAGVVLMSGGYAPLTVGGSAMCAVYAGSRKTATYSTGSITFTEDSDQVTGAGTAWVANVDAGMVISMGATGEVNVVKSVESDTALTLLYPHSGTGAAGAAYEIAPWKKLTSSAVVPAGCAEFVAGRVCAVPAGAPNRMFFTGFSSSGAVRLNGWSATDFHQFPGRVVGIHSLRDMALVFTTAGLFAVRNMAFDLTDAFGNVQQTVEKIDGLVLWSQQSVQAWGNRLVCAARDGVYLVDGVSSPVSLSRSVSKLYRSYVTSGYRPGQAAIFRDTYVLPIMNSSLTVQGWLSCRLDGSDDGRFWPWTRLSAGAMRCATVRNRADSQPKLLGGGAAAGTGRLALLSWFDPAAGVKNDADGTAPTVTLETRDYTTGTGQKNTVKKLRLWHELVDAGSDNPAWTVSYAKDGGSYTALSDTAAESDGTEPASWTGKFAASCRRIRFKVSCSTAAATGVIRSVEFFVRQSGRQ